MVAQEEVRQLRQEVVRLRADNEQLQQQLAQALALVTKLQAELEHLHKNPPPSIKPNTSKSKDKLHQSLQYRTPAQMYWQGKGQAQ